MTGFDTGHFVLLWYRYGSGFSELEKKVVMLVKSAGEVTLEFLCTKTGMNPVDMNGIIMVLEMKGYLATNFGKIFVAKF